MTASSAPPRTRQRVSAATAPPRPATPVSPHPAPTAGPPTTGPVPAPARQPRTGPALGWEERLLAAVSSPWRRWITVLIVGAVVGGIPATSAAAIYLFGFVIVDMVVTGCWLLGRRIVTGVKRRKRRGRR